VCPETWLPIRAEKLLLMAGIADSHSLITRTLSSFGGGGGGVTWWNFGPSLSTPTPSGVRPILHLLTKPSSTPSSSLLHDSSVYEKFRELVGCLGGDIGKVSRVYAIDHPSQRASFEHHRAITSEKHADSEGLFKKDGWRQASDAGVRKRYLLHLAEKITKLRHQFNDGSRAFVVPVVQGTSENAAFRIIKNGFGTVASVDDGWYGRGMYFTTSFKYASTYAKPSPHGEVFLIALTIPGNPYPATEPPLNNPTSLLGQACKAGYQSHYLEVTRSGQPAVNVDDKFGDELVVFEGSQALPLFLVYTAEFGGARTSETGPKGWGFLNQGSGEEGSVGEETSFSGTSRCP